jgi:uncharacterized protein (TIGR02147 family)
MSQIMRHIIFGQLAIFNVAFGPCIGSNGPMRVLDSNDFRKIVKDEAMRRSDGKRGNFGKLAGALNIHSTTLSHILSGKKSMSHEHALQTCEFFSFSELETEYFMLLVQLDRAGTNALSQWINAKLQKLKTKSSDLSTVLHSQNALSFEDQVTFYSHPHYSAIRVLSSINGVNTVEAIAKRLSVDRKVVASRLEFLIRTGLCRQEKDKLFPGPAFTHLESSSPLISKHHANWRVKAMAKHGELSAEELGYSLCTSISMEDSLKVRKLLFSMVKDINTIRENSTCEEAFFLCLDWQKV